MKVKLIISLLVSSWFALLQAQTSFDRTSFYKTISSNDLAQIDKEIIKIGDSPEKKAFKGALLMQKSGLVSLAKDKLKFFKYGHQQLELAIYNDSTNVEYRFLRLMIQENSPKIVRYNAEIKKDAAQLRKHYKNLPASAQQALLNYSKKSKELKPEDFKNTGA